MKFLDFLVIIDFNSRVYIQFPAMKFLDFLVIIDFNSRVYIQFPAPRCFVRVKLNITTESQPNMKNRHPFSYHGTNRQLHALDWILKTRPNIFHLSVRKLS